MTNRVAIVLGVMIAALFIVDAFAFDGHLPVFLGKKIFVFLDWIAFWR